MSFPVPSYLNVRQAAEIAHVKPRTIQAWIRRGWLKAHKPGGKCLLIDTADLHARIAATSVEPSEARS